MGAIYAVTGSASGIGAAVRARLEDAGNAVVGVDLRDAEIVADLSTPAGREGAVRALGERSGGTLDGLVVCAGLAPPHPARAIAAVNFFGATAIVDGALELLRAGSEPSAVVIASNSSALEGFPEEMVDRCLADDEEGALAVADEIDPGIVYVLSKRALARAIRRRAAAWAEAGVRLNAVAPGPTQTPMLARMSEDPAHGPASMAMVTPFGLGAPDDAADAVMFLLGQRWTHGALLFVDGGFDAIARPDSF